MRCPGCNTENDEEATACQQCKASLKAAARRARRNATAEAVSPRTEAYNRQVKCLFNLCLVSMVPFLGLILGPIGAIRARRLLLQARSDPAFTAGRAARAAVLLGILTATTQWLGLGCMVAGRWLG